MTLPDQVYIRVAPGGPFLGPAGVEQIRANVEAGEIPRTAEWVAATGQTAHQLKMTTGWWPLADLLGTEAPAAVARPAAPPVSGDTAPGIVSLFGWCWLILGLAGAFYYASLADEGGSFLYAIAIAIALQAILGCAVCVMLATMAERVERILRRIERPTP